MTTYLVTIGLIFALLALLIGVERLYRRFADLHPECGPFREKSFGCGNCKKRKDCDELHDGAAVSRPS
jgi:hypothetical protein